MSKIRQLIDYFTPENYQLRLNISKSQRRFNGTVVITGEPHQSEIRLHSKGLNIESLTTDTTANPSWQIDGDEIVIRDSKAHRITVSFAGHISETAMNGLYLCKYRLNGQDYELFATQFESHYARQCFPCIDEPAAKATFDITIATDDPHDSIVLSNMPGQLVNGVWKFATTPKMSTYLVAFVGGHLISKTGHTERGTTISTYATPAQPEAALDYALATAIHSVEFYENYFNVEYPLPKLDNVALPDFSAGAMENWGLITYRETAMLATSETSEASRESIATVIAHEISHQWFGDLVTMKWWNDLWLNESFASLMENTAVDHIYPEYNIWSDFETGDVLAALKRDSISGVQSVQQEVDTADEIATLFDGAIVYAKGERLLKMLQTYIGEDAFRRGLTNYFRKYQYDNTIADSLWNELSATSHINVKELMTPWLTRPNYPLVTASLDGNLLTLTQRPFLTAGQSDNTQPWPIPLFASSDEIPQVFNQQQLTVYLTDSKAMIMLNIGNSSHYIAQYDDALMNRIVTNYSNLSTTDKIKMLRESLLLSLAGLQDISQTVHLLRATQGEADQAVLTTMSNSIGSLNQLVELDTANQTALKHFTCNLFASQFDRLFSSHHQPTINDRKALVPVLARSVYGNNPSAVDYCKQQYQANAASLSAIPGDIRPTVLSTVIKHGDHDTFAEIWHQYQLSQDADLKMDLCAGLTATTNSDDIELLLDGITNSDIIRPQDVIYFVAWLLGNQHGRQQTWTWMRHNWPWIEQTFGGDMGYDDFVRMAGNSLSTKVQLREYDGFFEQVAAHSPALRRSIQIGHHSIENRIEWIERNRPVLIDLLQNQ